MFKGFAISSILLGFYGVYEAVSANTVEQAKTLGSIKDPAVIFAGAVIVLITAIIFLYNERRQEQKQFTQVATKLIIYMEQNQVLLGHIAELMVLCHRKTSEEIEHDKRR